MYNLDYTKKIIQQDITWLFPLIEKYLNFSKENQKTFIFAIDSAFEAPSYRYNYKDNIDKICERFGIELKNILIFGLGAHQFNDPVNFSNSRCSAFLPNIEKNSSHDILPTKKFISLARMPKEHRQLATVEILERDIFDQGYMSLGTSYLGPPHGNMNFDLVPEKYKKIMPLYLDGEVDFIAQHVAVDERFTSAFVNYVQETSFDREISPTSWNLPIISEKTAKPFVWGQVPIILCVADNIKYIRSLGFDLFDDVIDHEYYDKETNPILRIKKTVDQLERICRWSIEDCRDFKQKNLHRFKYNRDLAVDFIHGKSEKLGIQNLQKSLDSYDI
jgi:hypothetical protein